MPDTHARHQTGYKEQTPVHRTQEEREERGTGGVTWGTPCHDRVTPFVVHGQPVLPLYWPVLSVRHSHTRRAQTHEKPGPCAAHPKFHQLPPFHFHPMPSGK